jgi:hypothetical protein
MKFVHSLFALTALLLCAPLSAQSVVSSADQLYGQPGAVQVTAADGKKTKVPAFVQVDPTGASITAAVPGASSTGQSGVLSEGAVVSGDQAYTTGTTQPLNLTATGRLKVGLSSASNIAPAAIPTTTTTADLVGCRYVAAGVVFADTNTGAITCESTGSLRIATTPQSSATAAITPGASPAVEGGRVAKASAGNVYRVSITTGAAAGYLLGFNAIAIPADGAVTPSMCRVVAANSTLSVSYADMPARWGTGVTFVFSSTGCFTKTISATAFFEWSVM